MESRSHNMGAQRVVVTSTPAVRPSGSALPVHPSLQHVGRRRYLRDLRHRRRVQLTRRSAAVALGVGVVLSGPVLAISASPDAAARRTPAANARPNAAVPNSAPRNVARASGNAVGFQAPLPETSPTTTTPSTQDNTAFSGFTVTRNGKKRWVSYPAPRSHPFLVCTRSFESDTAGGYRAISPDGRHRGAYQFKRSTWNHVAKHVGRRDLVGVDPAAASRGDQDWMALYLYKWQGVSHWEGRCAGK